LNLSTYIAKRYLFAKKSHNAINYITSISVACITIGTMALIIVLSVFNGFDVVIRTQFNSFDPDVKITSAIGKTFIPNDSIINFLSKNKDIAAFSKTIEENVLLKYGEKQHIATIMGVDDNYIITNSLDTMVREGEFLLKKGPQNYAVIGQGIAYYLQVGLQFIHPIMVYVLRKDAPITVNPQSAINQSYIFPSGFFSVEQETDVKYMIVPLRFAMDLLEDTLSISAIDVKFAPGIDQARAKEKITQIMGSAFKVKNRYEQKELFYRIMKYEKWAIFLILSFILIIASFNVVGSLAVLIIEKKKDIGVLNSMGADKLTISRIFQFEGLMISFFGGLAGLTLGLLICWLQMKFGFLQLGGSGSFIIDAYPVSIKITDVLFVFFTVLIIGFLASWYTVKFIIKQYLSENLTTNS